MIAIYCMTLIFALYNSYFFVWRQKRYKNWIISAFYIFSVLVLIFRICYFMESVVFFTLVKKHE